MANRRSGHPCGALHLVKRLPPVRAYRKAMLCLQENGLSYTLRRTKDKLLLRWQAGAATKPLFTEKELEAQKSARFSRSVKFSLLVPLYNTPERFLREMIQSVLDQTYGSWELCMADGSDESHPEVEAVCRGFAELDERIRYRKLEKNLGISGNTNACLEMAEGDYIGLFDHDDILHPAALYEITKAICEEDPDFLYTDENTFHKTPEGAYSPHFKSAFAPDSLRGINYICHFSVFRRALLEKTGGFDALCDGSQDHDMILRLTEQAERVTHIPEILYYWRANANSVADDVNAKPYVFQAGIRAVERQLERLGLEGEVTTVKPNVTCYRVRYAIQGQPRVSILIPNCEHQAVLKNCLDSIYSRTTYPNFEVVIVENNSSSREVFAYYEQIQKAHDNLRVVTWEGDFNFSAVNNFGAGFCTGEHLLLLNNDIEVITPDWIQELLMFSQRRDVGAVGAMLYYPDDTIQHAGVILGLAGIAGHSHKNFPRNHPGYMNRLLYAQNLSAVTAACMMVSREAWKAVHGLDESFQVALNDVDFCLRLRQAGYLNVWTPFAELYHHESRSRGRENTREKRRRFEGEKERFRERWARELAAGDPYYHQNLTQEREDFSLNPIIARHPARTMLMRGNGLAWE